MQIFQGTLQALVRVPKLALIYPGRRNVALPVGQLHIECAGVWVVWGFDAYVCVCVCVCARALVYVRACVRACVRTYTSVARGQPEK
jgi:hypothetical protein